MPIVLQVNQRRLQSCQNDDFLSAINRNQCPGSIGISVRDRSEYAPKTNSAEKNDYTAKEKYYINKPFFTEFIFKFFSHVSPQENGLRVYMLYNMHIPIDPGH